MNIIVLFMVSVMAIFVWWMLLQRITAKPWLEQGVAFDPRVAGGNGYSPYVAGKLALWVFMVVISSLFMLFITAYHMRMELNDWRHLHLPGSLWFNTALLVVASIALQTARQGLERGNAGRVRAGYLAGGLFAMAFIAAQLWTWQQLVAAGHPVASNPAASFFYLLTGLHGVHLLGGLLVWGWGAARLLSGASLARLRLTIESCTVYWHYLLLLWLGLFALLQHG
ncbi:MAG: cytochrome c oxidase subunit 3 [Porticoccaceae bacterium]|jgi:cytochrome c oxidase subunit 3|nr:cytochrome c oxidase subunit 3 [Porticoccaceae bacterium]MEA3298731.1 cytochrome c oxidase subunit 3 [Pseudomonadota bacterium]HLS97371.1 cytochrome c oxidase subunit 3 [Porticoccaceae bacterium]